MLLLLSLVCQMARIFPGPVDHSASKESLYELGIANFFGNDAEAPLGSKFREPNKTFHPPGTHMTCGAVPSVVDRWWSSSG